MKLPMREKYVDEIVGRWMVFGVRDNGNVDISDANRDIFTDIHPVIAVRVVKLQNEFVDNLYKVLCK